ncbi:hypothetical protein RJ641_035825, partial [Dillenia turbinata]
RLKSRNIPPERERDIAIVIAASSGFSWIFASGFDDEIISSKESLRNQPIAFNKQYPVFCKLPDSPEVEPNPKVSRSEDYNSVMKRLMRNPYEYHHDLGMNYTLITENLIAEDFDPNSLRSGFLIIGMGPLREKWESLCSLHSRTWIDPVGPMEEQYTEVHVIWPRMIPGESPLKAYPKKLLRV